MGRPRPDDEGYEEWAAEQQAAYDDQYPALDDEPWWAAR